MRAVVSSICEGYLHRQAQKTEQPDECLQRWGQSQQAQHAQATLPSYGCTSQGALATARGGAAQQQGHPHASRVCHPAGGGQGQAAELSLHGIHPRLAGQQLHSAETHGAKPGLHERSQHEGSQHEAASMKAASVRKKATQVSE